MSRVGSQGAGWVPSHPGPQLSPRPADPDTMCLPHPWESVKPPPLPPGRGICGSPGSSRWPGHTEGCLKVTA